MKARSKNITILVAEDDPDDRVVVRDALVEALKRTSIKKDLRFVEDGEELMNYLHHRAQYKEDSSAPRPALILLDLNMPRKDGREALKEIKGEPGLRQIPVVALTTSRAEEDIWQTYDLGVNSFVTKPAHFEEFVEIIRMLEKYWFETVELPPTEKRSD